ncbi:MAG: hypothetical protein L0Z50_27450 [Verrucomicrobiales bacterium]|nr:hypothetical protein [Verrucomicrobiales bacterium]
MNRSAAILAAAGLTHPKRWTTKHMTLFQPAAARMAALRGSGEGFFFRVNNYD